ncbi:MAG: SRPBCC family protein [Akkermansiaceae bacterium]|nr:SRPBCC family protein [Akkermansiaceae bacterium]
MKLHTLKQEQFLPIPLEEAWDFFSSPENLDAITPDDLGFKITSPELETMYEGQIITYKVKLAPMIWVNWVTEIKALEEEVSFIDEQRFGPYAFWHHRHHFQEVDGGVKMTDLVNYGLPFGPFGAIAHGLFVRRKLKWIFGERRRILGERFGER